MATTPNWADLTVLKSPMYLKLVEADADRDAALVLLGQMVTAQMVSHLDNSNIDSANPPLALKRACLKQCTFEWRQRASVGLSSVQMSDGSINKYQIDEFLKDVEKILARYKRFALYETTDC